MPEVPLNDYTRVRQEHVTVEYASPDDGSPGAYASVGCLEGDFSIQRATGVVEDNIVNWCTIGIGASLASGQPDETTVTLSGTIVMLLGDDGYAQVHADAMNRVTGYWRITWKDGNTPQNTREDNFRGFYTQFDDVARQDGVSVTNFNVRVVELLSSES